ncbi:hypothetical protein BGZ47_010992, partial [Haplosporangium gracile]
MSDMGEILPKSSFHKIFKSFFGINTYNLDAKLTSGLAEMCSSIKLRLLYSRSTNPKTFKLITLHLDGHYSRVAYRNADKASMYSYKLRKSGFRTQRRGIELTEEENKYNTVFGSFSSKVESFFGNMQTTFAKCSQTVIHKVSNRNIFSIQYKLCYLLLNIEHMVALRNITTELHHSFWILDDFGFPDGEDTTKDMQMTTPSFKIKVNDAKSIYRLQENFLSLAISGHDTDQEMNNDDSQ